MAATILNIGWSIYGLFVALSIARLMDAIHAGVLRLLISIPAQRFSWKRDDLQPNGMWLASNMIASAVFFFGGSTDTGIENAFRLMILCNFVGGVYSVKQGSMAFRFSAGIASLMASLILVGVTVLVFAAGLRLMDPS